MFGRYDYTFHVEDGSIKAEIERKDGLYCYRRTCGEKRFERLLASESGGIIVNPVEPLSLPKEITNYLLIEFDPIIIEPGSVNRFYLTFPVEIGVFVESKRDIEVLDVFSLVHQKYTLYGSASDGVIARWYHSEIYPDIPEVHPLTEGVMELTIRNTCREWVTVSQAVFESYDMKIYYNDIVSMTAQMRIITKRQAETDILDTPLKPGMKKSIELYTARGIPSIKKGFLMEWGLA